MTRALMFAGLVAEGAAWWAVAARRWSVWVTMTPVLVGLGILTLVVDAPTLAEDVSTGPAAAVGLGAGVALYLATRAFVAIVAPRWAGFREQSSGMYLRRGSLPVLGAVALSVLLMVPGEELFWRGLFLGDLERSVGGVGAPVLAWAAYVLANVPSLNLAIVAGAVVGGAVWVALAAWTGGILSSLLCHACWTALMLALPPAVAAEGTA
jgi:membrane protease YdiL (CAAX protease family)